MTASVLKKPATVEEPPCEVSKIREPLIKVVLARLWKGMASSRAARTH